MNEKEDKKIELIMRFGENEMPVMKVSIEAIQDLNAFHSVNLNDIFIDLFKASLKGMPLDNVLSCLTGINLMNEKEKENRFNKLLASIIENGKNERQD